MTARAAACHAVRTSPPSHQILGQLHAMRGFHVTKLCIGCRRRETLQHTWCVSPQPGADPLPRLVYRSAHVLTLTSGGSRRLTDSEPWSHAASDIRQASWLTTEPESNRTSRFRSSVRIVTGAEAVAQVWDWENPPDDEQIRRHAHHRVDQADVAGPRRARAHYEQMYRRVGGVAVGSRLTAVLVERATPLLRAGYDNELGRELFRAVASLAALTGVCAYDADQQPLAQRYLFAALRLAKMGEARSCRVQLRRSEVTAGRRCHSSAWPGAPLRRTGSRAVATWSAGACRPRRG